MPAFCACGCGLQVAEVGHRRRGCRIRELADGRLCTRNVQSAAQERRNPKNNPKNNLKNDPKNSLARKLALRAANLQTVIDDPSISTTQMMSSGTRASVSILTDVDLVDLHA